MTEFRRGEVYFVSAEGDFGSKRRPAVIVQADSALGLTESITVCLMTSRLADAPFFRIRIEPAETNGLDLPSEVMVDKVASVRKTRLVRRLGTLSAADMARVDAGLADWLDLA